MTCQFALRGAMIGLAAVALANAGAASAVAPARYRVTIGNDLSRCAGAGPAVKVTVNGIKSAKGRIRVQLYRANDADWLEKGRWLHRIEAPARAGSMTFCMPVPAAGSYGIAVRHDANANGKTDVSGDGGGMSNNPSINLLNLGKPNFRKVAIAVGGEVKSISIQMRYL